MKKKNKMNKKKEKRITNTELLESINRSFSKIEKKMSTKEDIENLEKRMDLKMDTRIEGLKGQIQGIDKRIDDFVETRVKYEDHNKLKIRVGFIERKLEIKN